MVTDFNAKRKAVWNKIGVHYNEYFTQEDYIKGAGLDFNVIKAPLYAKCFDKDKQPLLRDKSIGWKNMPQSYALLRDDNGYMFTDKGKAVTDSYSVFQNSDMFNLLDNLCDIGKIDYATAGHFDFGKRVFVTIDLNDQIEIFGDDVIDRYLLITSRHDGKGAINIRFVNQRVICENTLNLALRENYKHQWNIRHTPLMDERIDTIKEIIGDLRVQKLQVSEKLAYYRNVEMTDRQQLAILALSYFDTKSYVALKRNNFVLTEEVLSEAGTTKGRVNNSLKEFNAIRATMEQGVGQNMYNGTLLNVYNGITCYIQNVKEYNSNEQHFDTLFDSPIIDKFENHLLDYLQEVYTL